MNKSVRLRPFSDQDIDSVFDAVRESIDEISPWMGWCHADYSVEDTRTWIDGLAPLAESGSEYVFAIVDDGDRILGACGLNRMDGVSQTANLGYWVRTSATRRGVASGAVHLLQEHSFGELKLHRLEILAAVDNVASQRVALKAGAEREGLLRERLLVRGVRQDAYLFSLLNPEN